MEAFLLFIGIVTALLVTMGLIAGIAIWIYNATNRCPHSYERVDTYNDKNMILVCRRCGKIKKLKK